MNTIVEACLKSINDVNENKFMAELDACNALFESYEKAMHIMEYYGTNNFSFLPAKIITEAEEAQNPPVANNNAQPVQSAANNQQQQTPQQNNVNREKPAWEFQARQDKKDGSGKESLFVSIIAFIPRLIIAVIKFIGRSLKNLFGGKNKTEQAVNSLTQQIDQAPDAFKRWAVDDDKLTQLLKEASGQENWVKSFRISPVNFKNSTDIPNDQANKGKTAYEVWVYPPMSIDTIENNFQAFTVNILDPVIVFLQKLFIHKNVNEKNEVTRLTGESVEKIKSVISKFDSVISKQLEVANGVKQAQSSGRLIVDVPDGNGGTTLNYGVTPKSLYEKLGKLTQIEQVMEKKTAEIRKLVEDYQKQPNTIAPDSPETFENFKNTINLLKDTASKTVSQLKFISDLTTTLQNDTTKAAQLFNTALDKWKESNPENASGAENTQTDATANTTENVNTDTSSPLTSDNIPDEAYAALDERNRRQAIPEAAKGVGNAIVGAAKKVGNVVSNGVSKVKKLISKNPNAMHVVRVKDPTGMDPKFGVARRIEIPEKSIPEFTKKWKNQGFEVTVLESSNLIGIDDDGNRYEITLEEYIENYSDIEIITEQEYLTYYQFENISSLEY